MCLGFWVFFFKGKIQTLEKGFMKTLTLLFTSFYLYYTQKSLWTLCRTNKEHTNSSPKSLQFNLQHNTMNESNKL